MAYESTGRPPGQPTKFTPEIKEKLLTAIKKGAPYELACNYARIHYTTVLNWKKKAEKELLPEYIEFFNDLKEAEGSTALKWLNVIDKSMSEGVWQAAAWKLERRHAKYFSSNSAIVEMNERLDKLEKGDSNEKGSHQEDCQKDDKEI